LGGAGSRWADAIRRAREARRVRRRKEIEADLEKEQAAFEGALDEFLNVLSNERETWDLVEIEVAEIRRLLDGLDRCVRMVPDASAPHRQPSGDLLAGIRARRKLLAQVQAVPFEHAVRKRPMLAEISAAYAALPALSAPVDVPVPVHKLAGERLQEPVSGT
jgi:hypothetical protein